MTSRCLSGMMGLLLAFALLVGLGLPWGGPAAGQQIHRNGFELQKPAWVKGGYDAPYEEKAHAVTDRTSHDGRHSEYIHVEARGGSFIHYNYPTGKALVGEELSAGVWLKANRPGLQLLARVVLPREPDPNNLDRRMTTTIKGDAYQRVGQWQRLEIGRAVHLTKKQQQLMQQDLKRPLDFSDAYVDQLVLNLHGGPGATEVWVDDVEIGPVQPESVFQPAVRPTGPATKEAARPTARVRPGSKAQAVDFSGNHLKVGKDRFFFRGIRVTDTPLAKLREARFNTLFLDQGVSQSVLREAGEAGVWVVPMVRLFGDDTRPVAQEAVTRELSRFAENDLLFTHVGNTLVYEQVAHVTRSAQAIRVSDPGRVIAGDVWDGMQPYSRQLQLVGAHRWPLMTTLELPKYREWLDLRRRLANNDVFLWTWIPTHLPDWYTELLYDRGSAGTFEEPVGPQPEHIQLLTYSAIASGSRGLAYWSDRFLADSHQGRDRLLCCALLNLELEMLEPLLVTVDDPPEWIETSVPEVKAAVLRSAHGVLVLPIWQGTFAQFVPGQAAVNKLEILVPQVPQSTLAWEVSPGEVRGLKFKRDVGGTKVTIPEFGLTSAVVFTSNTELVGRFQQQAEGRRQLAAQWTYDMALYELEKVLKVHEQLEKQGHTLPDGAALVAKARELLQKAKRYWDDRNFAESYREAQRALRPVRILMRAQWENAVRGLDSPTSCPYAVTYYTLPRHWQFMDQVRRSAAGANALPGGDFELGADRGQEPWRIEEPASLDEVELIARRVTEIEQPGAAPGPDGKVPVLDQPKEGRQCAMLKIKPKGSRPVPPGLERTLLALSSPPVRLQPGTLVQVSGWVRIPAPIVSSPDGALLYDSVGGEPLAVRLTDATAWKKFTLYRRVPASGTMNVTLALTGVGTVYFDDVRIEPLAPPGSAAPRPAEVAPAGG